MLSELYRLFSECEEIISLVPVVDVPRIWLRKVVAKHGGRNITLTCVYRHLIDYKLLWQWEKIRGEESAWGSREPSCSRKYDSDQDDQGWNEQLVRKQALSSAEGIDLLLAESREVVAERAIGIHCQQVNYLFFICMHDFVSSLLLLLPLPRSSWTGTLISFRVGRCFQLQLTLVLAVFIESSKCIWL